MLLLKNSICNLKQKSQVEEKVPSFPLLSHNNIAFFRFRFYPLFRSPDVTLVLRNALLGIFFLKTSLFSTVSINDQWFLVFLFIVLCEELTQDAPALVVLLLPFPSYTYHKQTTEMNKRETERKILSVYVRVLGAERCSVRVSLLTSFAEEVRITDVVCTSIVCFWEFQVPSKIEQIPSPHQQVIEIRC